MRVVSGAVALILSMSGALAQSPDYPASAVKISGIDRRMVELRTLMKMS